MKKCIIFAFLLIGPVCYAQSATIDWTKTHQVIDGFGAMDAVSVPLTTPQRSFFFGTSTGQLGLSIIRVQVPDDPGKCSSVSSVCAGDAAHISDMAAAVADGARIYASSWTPPATYKTNGDITCTAGGGSGTIISGDYGAFATWLSNFVRSVTTYVGTAPYALSPQNEPDACLGYDSAIWTAAQFHDFITNNLGPTFNTAGYSTLIMMPEDSQYSQINGYGYACATDSTCASYVGGVDFHEYGSSESGYTPNSTPYPSGWPAKEYWETEASCGAGFGPGGCAANFTTSMNDGLYWAAMIDHRIAVDNVNAWLYWWLVDENNGDNQGLLSLSGAVTKRAYVMGQYSRFIRPGYHRIDATHAPQSGVSVSAYQDTPSGTMVIVATNYTGSPLIQTFNVANAPTFANMTPYITSTTQNIEAQSPVTVGGDSFTYTLPAESITTFVGASSSSATPAPPTGLRAVVN